MSVIIGTDESNHPTRWMVRPISDHRVRVPKIWTSSRGDHDGCFLLDPRRFTDDPPMERGERGHKGPSSVWRSSCEEGFHATISVVLRRNGCSGSRTQRGHGGVTYDPSCEGHCRRVDQDRSMGGEEPPAADVGEDGLGVGP